MLFRVQEAEHSHDRAWPSLSPFHPHGRSVSGREPDDTPDSLTRSCCDISRMGSPTEQIARLVWFWGGGLEPSARGCKPFDSQPWTAHPLVGLQKHELTCVLCRWVRSAMTGRGGGGGYVRAGLSPACLIDRNCSPNKVGACQILGHSSLMAHPWLTASIKTTINDTFATQI